MELKDLTSRDLEVIKAITGGVISGQATVQGFVLGSGLEAIHLDALAKLAYNIFYPELRKIPHINPEMAGQRWGGTAYQWKSILTPNATSLPAPVSPGNRNAIASITSAAYSAPYATLGYDQSVQDEEYEQERGFDDPLKNARITTMHNILRMYDILATDGNRGSDTNGFALGTAPTPSLVASATGGSIPESTKVTVACVELTAYSMLPFINGAFNGSGSPVYKAANGGNNGLIQTVVRTPANLSTSETIPAGTGVLGAEASVTTSPSTSTGSVVASVNPSVGACGWAWFVSVNASPSIVNSYFYAVTRQPNVTITAAPSTSNQLANSLSSTDYSFNGSSEGTINNTSDAFDFDGAFAYIANSQLSDGGSLSAGGAGWNQWINMKGAAFQGDGAGGEENIEAAVIAQFNAYQAVPEEIVCGVNAISPLTQAVLSGTTTSNLRFFEQQGADGQTKGSAVLQDYRLKFSPDGNQRVLPVSVSPNIPANAVWLPTRRNPFPSTSATIPAVLQLAEIKPMYSLDYARTRRTWEIGTYVQTTLVNRAPFIGALLVGSGY